MIRGVYSQKTQNGNSENKEKPRKTQDFGRKSVIQRRT